MLQPGARFREYLHATGSSAALDAGQPWRTAGALLRDAAHALGGRLFGRAGRRRWDVECGGAGHEGGAPGGGHTRLTLFVAAGRLFLCPPSIAQEAMCLYHHHGWAGQERPRSSLLTFSSCTEQCCVLTSPYPRRRSKRCTYRAQ